MGLYTGSGTGIGIDTGTGTGNRLRTGYGQTAYWQGSKAGHR